MQPSMKLSTVIASFVSTIIPSAVYISEPFNMYAHLSMPKPFSHNVGHPSFTNLFMASRSVLFLSHFSQCFLCIEKCRNTSFNHVWWQVHLGTNALPAFLCVMQYHGMGTLLDHPAHGVCFRRVLCKTMTMDMSVHTNFMNEFGALINSGNDLICHHQILICWALMKCADISNPVSPGTSVGFSLVCFFFWSTFF